MRKKIFQTTLTVLQILFLISAYTIHYFASNRMGMMRYVVFKNQEWEQQYAISSLQHAAIFVSILFVILTIITYLRMKKNSSNIDGKAVFMLMIQFLLTSIFIYFTMAFSTKRVLSYYWIDLVLAIVVLLHELKMLLYMKR